MWVSYTSECSLTFLDFLLTTEENSSSVNGSLEMDEERAKVSEDTPVTPLSDTIIGKATWNYTKYNLFSVILLLFSLNKLLWYTFTGFMMSWMPC